MKSFLNSIRKNSILALGGFVLAGILLILFPHKIANIAGYIAGALALGFGVTKIINYFSKKKSLIIHHYKYRDFSGYSQIYKHKNASH